MKKSHRRNGKGYLFISVEKKTFYVIDFYFLVHLCVLLGTNHASCNDGQKSNNEVDHMKYPNIEMDRKFE